MEKVLEPRVYEVGYHILPIVPEAALEGIVADVKKLITKIGGEVIDEGAPSMMNLAYEMGKIIENKRVLFSSANFGWIKFDAKPGDIAQVNKFFDTHAKVLRFLLIETVREETFIQKQLEEEESQEAGDKEKSNVDPLNQSIDKAPAAEEAKTEEVKTEDVAEEAADAKVDESVEEK